MTQILSLDRTDRVALDTTALLRLEVALGATRSREVLPPACCAARGAADSLMSGVPVASAATTERRTRLGEVSLDTLLHPVTTEDH